jgi:hypothetical protein
MDDVARATDSARSLTKEFFSALQAFSMVRQKRRVGAENPPVVAITAGMAVAVTPGAL